MTYAAFLGIFLLVPIALLLFLQPKPLAGLGTKRAWWSIPALALIAFTYTTPWDNYLVYRNIWWYGTDRVLATIGYVPVEEYLFFLLQPVLTGLWLYWLLGKKGAPPPPAPVHNKDAVRRTGVLFYGSVSVIGAGLLLAPNPSGTYMGLILAWAGPVLAGLWYYGGPHIWHLRRTFFLGFSIPTLYLWVADWYAIQDGIWDISNTLAFDIDPFGLPIEEATFFLVTNLLVIQGTLLFVHGHIITPPEPIRRYLVSKDLINEH